MLKKNLMLLIIASFFIPALLTAENQYPVSVLNQALLTSANSENFKNIDHLEDLIKQGADVNCLNSKKQSPLILSIIANNPKVFYFLLEHGADPNLQVAGNHTPLHYLTDKCRRGIIWNSAEIKALVDKGANVNAQDAEGKTPLMAMVPYSSYYVSDDEVETILKLGADPNIQDKDGETSLYKAAYDKNMATFNLLLKYGADPAIGKYDGRTILFKAVDDNITEIIKICINKKVDLDAADKNSWTPLMRAADWGRYDAVKMLLEAGADPNIKDSRNKTAFDIAMSNDRPTVARLLINHGADTGKTDKKKIDEILKKAKEEAGELLGRIAGKADLATVKDLIKSGADINRDYYGDTPLLSAVAGQNRKVALYLIDKGADPNKATRSGITPLMMMSGYNDNFFYIYRKIVLNRLLQGYDGRNAVWSSDDIEELIDKGAKVDAQSKDGRTALMFAAFNHYGTGNEEKLEELLDEDADPAIKDNSGDTALFYSVSKNPKLFLMLAKEGADINIKNNKDETALHRAAGAGASDIVSYYINKKSDINIKDKHGWTPLMAASLSGDPDTVRLLINAGAAVNENNTTGNSAIDLAMIGGQRAIVKLLTQAGAKQNPDISRNHYLDDPGSSAGETAQDKESNLNPEFVVQLSHSNGITCMDMSKDGRYALTGSYDKTIRLWDIRSEKLVRTLFGHEKYIQRILFLPDNKRAISGGGDTDLFLWDLSSGKIIRKFTGHTDSIEGLYILNNGKHVLSIASDKTVRLWDISSGKQISMLNREAPGARVGFEDADKSQIFPDHYYERLIKVEKDNTIKEIKGAFNDALLSPDGKYLVSLKPDYEKEILIWDAKTFEQLDRITKPGYTRLKCLDFSDDGRMLIAGTNSASEMNNPPEIVLYDFKGRKFLKRFNPGGTVRNIKFLPGNKRVLATIGSSIGVWDIRTGERLTKLERRSGSITGIELSPDGNYCLAVNNNDEQIKIWNLNTAKLVKTIKGAPESVIFNAKFSPDGKTITYLSGIPEDRHYKRSVITIDTKEGKEISSFPCVSQYITNIDISNDGKLVAGNAIISSGIINIWNRETGEEIKTLMLKPMKYINSVRISPDGKYLLAGSGKWELGFSGGGVDEPGMMILWDIETGKPAVTYFSDGIPVQTVAFSPDGKRVLAGTGYDDRNIPGDLWVFDTMSGKKLLSFEGHTNSINTAAFSPDGKYIVSGSNDHTIKLWDAASGKEIRTYDSHTSDIYSLAFTNNGKYILSGSRDGTMKYWNLYSGRHMSFVCNNKEWVIYNDSGYFDSSRNGSDLVAMVQGMSAYGIDQFAIKNNRPDLILSSMDMGTPGLIEHFRLNYLRRLERLGINEDKLKNSNNLPFVEITDAKTSGKKVIISFNISDDKVKLHHYNIYVNDCSVYGEKGEDISGSRKVSVKETIELTSGTNKIEISAVNEAGAESFRALTFAEYKEVTRGDLYFMGFGVSQYRNKDLNLAYAHKDATDLAGYFSKMKGRQFKKVFVKTYLNNAVTTANIKNAAEFFKKAGVDDTVVLFIAGHGVYDRGKEATYYYLTYDADIQNLSGTAANFELIENILQGIAPRKKLFLIDTCESGEMDEALKNEYFTMAGKRGIKPRTSRSIKSALSSIKPGDNTADTGRGLKIVTGKTGSGLRKYLYEKDRYIYNDLLRRSGAIVFSSSRGGEFSYESQKIKNGFFTKSIINALTGKTADKDNDKIISTEELRDYVIKDVPKRTWDKQHPTVDRDNIYQKFGFPAIYSK